VVSLTPDGLMLSAMIFAVIMCSPNALIPSLSGMYADRNFKRVEILLAIVAAAFAPAVPVVGAAIHHHAADMPAFHVSIPASA